MDGSAADHRRVRLENNLEGEHLKVIQISSGYNLEFRYIFKLK